ncbi:FAD-dependent monooxygenase [Rhodococcus sp. NPDC127530]|uniref:FAD-dependent monooxygenase n=1 Tax=unclassified Rhodococcus (in: high G+C Gram-positive bacteria) TaxID=192944 RepID=UPI0036349519
MSIPDQNSSPQAAPLRVACIGGGPGGLFSAIALAQTVPGSTIDVFERNNESDVFGFGVVFSDATLDNVDRVDPVLRDTLGEHGRHWDTIEVRSKGVTTSAGGNGMSAVHRRILLGALQDRATELGARLHFSTTVDVDALDACGEYDLIIAADGANSASRERFVDELGHSVDEAAVKFIWFGTTFQFDGLTFLHKQSEHGNFAVHAYPIGSDLSTFIVETDEATWRRAGLDGFDMSTPPGQSDLVSQRYLEELFADQIDGHKLVANNSRWANFRTRRTRRWHTRAAQGTPVVVLGDAVHTAHFSVGSGTKMAMEDAAVLAQTVADHRGDLDTALAAFGDIRRPQVAKIQDSAMPSLSWWDHFGEYYRALEPWQFGFHFFSRAISAEKIRVRDPRFVSDAERSWNTQHGAAPLDTPLSIGTATLAGRLLQITDLSDESLQFTDGTTAVAAGASTGAVALFTAPDVDRTSIDEFTRTELDQLCARKPVAVAVRGGTALSRVLCAEHVRFTHHIPVVIVDQPASLRARRAVDERDCAATLILSGRADAVAFEPTADARPRVLTSAEVAK